MSSIARSAKSGSDWTSNELEAYNITIQNQSAKTFFGQDLPATLAGIDPDFADLDATTPDQAADDDTYRALVHLDLATKANAGIALVQTLL